MISPLAHPRASGGSPQPEVASELPVDSCSLSPVKPRRIRPDYMWESAPLWGPVGVVLRFAINTCGLGRRIGLEPAPAREPVPQPLGFSWTGTDQFPTQVRRLEALMSQPGVTEAGKKRLGGGGNGSFLVELSSGPCVVWKPRSYEVGTSERAQLRKADQARREVAAYQVDGFLGHLVRVPPAVASGLEGRPGTLSLFVPGCVDSRDLGEKPVVQAAVAEQEYRNLALFDHVIGNLDRHGGNWMIDQAGHIVPIDHGLAFPLRNREQGVHNFDFDRDFALNPQETARLNSFLLRRGEIRDSLTRLLEPQAIEAMFERVERMLSAGRTSSWWREQPASG